MIEPHNSDQVKPLVLPSTAHEVAIRRGDNIPDQDRDYQCLLELWRMTTFADGFKSFAINDLSVSRLWKLSGCSTWREFCEKVLRVNVRTALRMRKEGAVARVIPAQIPDLNDASGNINISRPFAIDPFKSLRRVPAQPTIKTATPETEVPPC